MITHLLDTNVAINLIASRSETLLRRVIACPSGSLALSILAVHELYYGAYRSGRVEQNLETLRLFLRDFELLDFSRQDAIVAGEIRAALKANGTPIGPYDVLIAGQAKARDLVLVTNNTREFDRVPGLRVEDWLR